VVEDAEVGDTEKTESKVDGRPTQANSDHDQSR
jgi:hypothetical protein